MAQIPYLDAQNLTKSFGAQVLFKIFPSLLQKDNTSDSLLKMAQESLPYSLSLLGKRVMTVVLSSIAMICEWEC